MARLQMSKPPYSPTRFPAGVNNSDPTSMLGWMGQLDPTKFQTFFEDFIAAPAALGTFTAIAGAGGLATVATTNTVGTPLASFNLNVANRRWFFKARLSLATVANGITVGFGDALTATAAGVTLTVANNTATLQSFGGTALSSATTVTTVNATMYELGFQYIPRKGVSAYIDYLDGNGPREILFIAANTFSSTNMIAGIRPNGATATVDYIFAAIER